MCHLPLQCLRGEMNTSNPLWEHLVCSHSPHVQCRNPTGSQSLSKDFLIPIHFILRKHQGSYKCVCVREITALECSLSPCLWIALPIIACRWRVFLLILLVWLNILMCWWNDPYQTVFKDLFCSDSAMCLQKGNFSFLLVCVGVWVAERRVAL